MVTTIVLFRGQYYVIRYSDSGVFLTDENSDSGHEYEAAIWGREITRWDS